MQKIKDLFKNQSGLLAVLAAITAGLVWLAIPAGNWLGRFWSVGSSVCHQIPSHSLIHNYLQFPLCARCTGLYIGCLVSLIYYFTQGKRKSLPERPYRYALLFFFILWAGDGLNSFLNDLLNRIILYETTNITRLVTGFGMGLVMSTALMTLFNTVVWKDAENSALLQNITQIFFYAFTSLFFGWMLLHPSKFFFNIMSLASIITVLIVISMLYMIFWVIILKKENQFKSFPQLIPYILVGLATALTQVYLLNMLRSQVL